MDKIPHYAIVCETMLLVKKYCHSRIHSFIYAVLIKLKDASLSLPNEKDSKSLSFYYSYPEVFIEKLIDQYGLDEAEKILNVQNQVYPPFFWVKGFSFLKNESLSDLFYEEIFKIYKLKSSSYIKEIVKENNVYIQNYTPIYLIEQMSKRIKNRPNKIMDFCSSPGGKLILTHDIFPEADFFANDVTEKKIIRLKQNLDKYGIKASISKSLLENFVSEEKFDLIILDVPCSNSGVLSRRAEARWRLSDINIKKYHQDQFLLLKRSIDFLEKDGQIFYLTCSILKEENQYVTQKACEELGLKKEVEYTILPDEKGRDGGYGCSLHF